MESTSPSAANRYAAPQAHVEDVRDPQAGAELAGRGMRFVAALIDLVVLMAAMWLLSLVTPWNPYSPRNAASIGSMLFNAALGFVLFLALNGWLLVSRGQTIGKRVMGQRITLTDGNPVPPLRLLGLRYGIGYAMSPLPWLQMIYALVDCLMVFRSSRRCLHDVLAGTIVVKA
ncbi:RDD family protein [Ideonella sp. BN130291]|uniref:RDD family protein n=1 Tax=Ideonella sp. BN130291 TaxID=3112940 RepID=UPI002E26F2C6|nr:RDD family protein [Ideonella sp. BN130291]